MCILYIHSLSVSPEEATSDVRWKVTMSAQTSNVAGDLLEDIVRRLVDFCQPERIYLFGSVARGDAGPDSDFDILVVLPDSSGMTRKGYREVHKALWGVGASVDVLFRRLSEFEADLPLKASLPATVLREGRLLYGHR
jgi:predicted nucleotidyltransferase